MLAVSVVGVAHQNPGTGHTLAPPGHARPQCGAGCRATETEHPFPKASTSHIEEPKVHVHVLPVAIEAHRFPLLFLSEPWPVAAAYSDLYREMEGSMVRAAYM